MDKNDMIADLENDRGAIDISAAVFDGTRSYISLNGVDLTAIARADFARRRDEIDQSIAMVRKF